MNSANFVDDNASFVQESMVMTAYLLFSFSNIFLSEGQFSLQFWQLQSWNSPQNFEEDKKANIPLYRLRNNGYAHLCVVHFAQHFCFHIVQQEINCQSF